MPVAADFTAPLMAAYPEFGGDLWPALKAAINPDTWLPSSGLYAWSATIRSGFRWFSSTVSSPPRTCGKT